MGADWRATRSPNNKLSAVSKFFSNTHQYAPRRSLCISLIYTFLPSRRYQITHPDGLRV